MTTETCACRAFISKHTVGMCGAGKFMQRRKKSKTADCPRCGTFEDVPHAWTCPDNKGTQIWETYIIKLQEWMTSIDNDPNIQAAVLEHLKGWCSGPVINSHYTPHLQQVIHQQNLLGWQLFFEGWLLQDWVGIQQLYYIMIRSCWSGKRWVVSIINKMWNTAWDLWDHKNGLIHEQTNVNMTANEHNVNQRIPRTYFNHHHTSLPKEDHHLISSSLKQMLSKPIAYKSEWIRQWDITIARVHLLVRSQTQQMRRSLYNWLHNHHVQTSAQGV
jgi:hypothetical protein